MKNQEAFVSQPIHQQAAATGHRASLLSQFLVSNFFIGIGVLPSLKYKFFRVSSYFYSSSSPWYLSQCCLLGRHASVSKDWISGWTVRKKVVHSSRTRSKCRHLKEMAKMYALIYIYTLCKDEKCVKVTGKIQTSFLIVSCNSYIT